MRGAGTLGKRVGYGWLYNWYAVDDARGLAPEGWDVPTDAEWTELTDYLIAEYGHITSSNVGGALKSTRNEWLSPNTGAKNEFGFSALPGGYRRANGSFTALGSLGYWWSATESGSNAWIRFLNSGNAGVGRATNNKAFGFSVRCLQPKNPSESDGDTGTLTDIDGNVYKWVVIGNYRWMAENLRTSKYRDGTNIPHVTDDTEWENLTTGARCAYNNDHYFINPAKK